MPLSRQVTVLLPPSATRNRNPLLPPAYPSLASMHQQSRRICTVLDQRGIKLVGRSWRGSATELPQDERCLVHYSCSLCSPAEIDTLIKACDQAGHLLFCSDRIYNKGKELQPELAVEQWLDSLVAPT